jgi:hypothetical protein
MKEPNQIWHNMVHTRMMSYSSAFHRLLGEPWPGNRRAGLAANPEAYPVPLLGNMRDAFSRLC